MFYVSRAVNGFYNVIDTLSGAVNQFNKYDLLDLVRRNNTIILGVDTKESKVTTYRPSDGVFSEQAASFLIRKVMKTILDVKAGATLGLNMYWLDEGIFGFGDKEIWLHNVSCYTPYNMEVVVLDIVLTNPGYLMNTEFAGLVSIAGDNMIHIEIPSEIVILGDDRLKVLRKLFTFIDRNRKVFLSK